MDNLNNNGVSREFAEKILKWMNYKDVALQEIKVKKGASVGDNFTTDMLAVELHVVSNQKKSSIVNVMLKRYPRTTLRQQIHLTRNLFGKEIGLYETIVNDIKQKHVALGYEPLQLAIPEFIHGEDNGTKSFLVMEDLKVQGYRMVTREDALDFDHVVLTVKELAKWHASAMLLKLDGDPKEKYPEFLKELLTSSFETISTVLEKNLDIASEIIQEHSSRAGELGRFTRFRGSVVDTIVTHFSDVREPYVTICHGDLWFNNLMFSYDQNSGKGNVPQAVKFVDWQLIRYGSPALDLSYLLYISTDALFRKKHLSSILKLYHQTLVGSLKSFGQDTAPYTFDTFEEEWLRHRRFGFLYGLIFAYAARIPADMVVDMDSISDAHDSEGCSNIKDAIGSFGNGMTQKCIDVVLSTFDEGLDENIL